MIKDNKTERIHVRISKEVKEQFLQALEQDGDTISGFFNRAIAKYLNSKQKEA